MPGCTTSKTPSATSNAACGTDGSSPCPPACAYTGDDLKKAVQACDGGTGVWGKAKTVAGKDPTPTIGPEPSGFGASTDTTSKTITINCTKFPDKCVAIQVLVFELTNL